MKSISTQILNKAISDNEYISLHDKIFQSGKYNFEGCREALKHNLKIDFFRFMLTGYSDSLLCDFLEFGFPIGYFGKHQQAHSNIRFVKNHKGAKEFPVQISKFLKKEKSYNAILGPYRSNPFCCNAVVSPLNSVPKKDSEDRRIILDLSYPKCNSINDFISKDWYLGEKIKLTYPKVDDLVNIIKIKGRHCLLFKRDLKRAYRQIWIDPGDASLLGYSFNGQFYWDKVLSMGLRSAALICQKVTNSINYMCQILGILIINYLDDLAGADSAESANKCYFELGKILEHCGLEEASEKACPPNTVMTCLGILFDTDSLTLQVTPERLAEILDLVNNWLNKSEASLSELQSLIGKLQFVSSCVKPSRVFICRLLNWLRQIQDTGSLLPIPFSIKKDLIWWKKFLPVYNGISMMDFNDWSEPDSVISCDASLVGCGGWFAGYYFHSDFPDFIKIQSLHINELELLTIVVALKVWRSFLRGKKMIVNCDNSTSCKVINSGYSRNEFLQTCLREICFQSAVYGFQLRANSISGTENRIPDYLSRWSLGAKYSNAFMETVKGIRIREFIVSDELFQFSHDW